jgi:hypothetical protein
MTDRKKEFHDVIERLIPFGEDEKELRYWEAIFDDLTPEEQDEVMANLKEELALFEKQKKK